VARLLYVSLVHWRDHSGVAFPIGKAETITHSSIGFCERARKLALLAL